MRRGEIKTNFGKRKKIKYQGGIKKKKTLKNKENTTDLLTS